MKALAFTGGDWVIYILIACSVLTVAVIVERAVVLSREKKGAPGVRKIFDEILSTGDWQQAAAKLGNFQVASARVLAEGFSRQAQGLYILEEALTAAVNREKRRLEERMIILNTLGGNAVYIGLFGTVLGVIKAFRDLSLQGGGGAEVVMQGLSEALVATAIGLFAAIPAVIAYNRFAARGETLISRYYTFADEFQAILHRKVHTSEE